MEFIEQTIRGKYPEIDSSKHNWKELINVNQEYGPGWNDLVIELVRKIEKIYDKRGLDPSDFCILQTKEKYGTLRFYATSSLKEVVDLIDEYEEKSSRICEMCGEPGKFDTSNGYVQTLCSRCIGLDERKR